MTQKQIDARKLFENPTIKACEAMIKKHARYLLPDRDSDYKENIQYTICEIFVEEMVEFNLHF